MLLSLLYVFLLSSSLMAQEGQPVPVGSELSIYAGPFLPNQIEGITEIINAWGMRYGWSYDDTGTQFVELGVTNGRGEGADLYNFHASIRGDMPLDTLIGSLYMGLDGYFYKPATESNFIMSAGGHVGGGFLALVGGDVWLRSDLKFNFNPGTSLFLGFGLVMRWPQSQDNE